MSTNTKKKHGTGAAVVLIVLCLLALGTLSTHAVQAFAHASGPTPAAQARHFDDKAALLAALRAALPGMGSVLVKGSRFMKMEDAVQALQEATCS